MLDFFTIVASFGLQSDMNKVAADRPGNYNETVETNHTGDDVADMADVLSSACQAVEDAVTGVASLLTTAPTVPDLRLPTSRSDKQ